MAKNAGAPAKSPSRAARTGTSGTDRKSNTHNIEWVLGACSGLMILGIAGFLCYEAVTRTGGQPELSLRVVERSETATGETVVVEVRNDGHATAASVEVAGTFDGVSWRQVTLDYSPAHSRRKVTLLFPKRVHNTPIELHVAGYVDP
jgi:uncharacterized protein (TIGR02588 family)